MEEIMRKHSKFITILLSALLAVCLVQTVFVQAFATEMGDDDFGWGSVSTPDEPTEDLYPVSMEIVKAPESVTVFYGEIYRWEDLVRCGVLYDWVMKFNGEAKAAGTMRPFHKLRPIPQNHIDRLKPAGKIEEEQNEGYY